MAKSLAIYRLEPASADVTHHIELADKLFGIKDDFKLEEVNSRRVMRSGERVVELYAESGGIWD